MDPRRLILLSLGFTLNFCFHLSQASPIQDYKEADTSLVEKELLDEGGYYPYRRGTRSKGHPEIHHIKDCITVSMDEGIFEYKSNGGAQTCGIFLTAEPNQNIVLTVEQLDAECDDDGLISIVDGWELNGEVFPGVTDHEKTLKDRFVEMCIGSSSRKRAKRIVTSSQNAALVQFRIPRVGQGFIIQVQHVTNPTPCNILVQDVESIYTLENFGAARNCSLTTIFHAKFRILYMAAGLHTSKVKFSYSSSATPVFSVANDISSFGPLYPFFRHFHHSAIHHECNHADYLEIGGASGLDNSRMTVIDKLCGILPHSRRMSNTIFCQMSSMRLVSSGRFKNKVVAEVHKADIEDIDDTAFICDL